MIYQAASQRRSGMVLLVVMALLALFAVVGLSFVFFADAEAIASDLGKQALLTPDPEADPETLGGYFLSRMLYDDEGVYSSLRGWSLARSMYGYNPNALNFTPYNGAGRDAYAPIAVNDPVFGVPYFSMINQQWHYDPNNPADPTINFALRPEYYGKAAAITPGGASQAGATVTILTAGPHGLAVGNPVTISGVGVAGYNGTFVVSSVVSPIGFRYTALVAGLPPSGYGTAGQATFRYVGGANAPWTGYDTNSLFLAQVRADGTVLMPSFYRPWLAPGVIGDVTGKAKYQSLRPHGTWHPGFYFPPIGSEIDPATGMVFDVRNLDFGPGRLTTAGYQNNDSFWIDMGYPVRTAPNGKRYKALVAPLIIDLSNRLHLWAHGNRRGGADLVNFSDAMHVSNEGHGAPEVNINLRMPRVSAIINPNARTTPPITLPGASLAGTTVTIRTPSAHGFLLGDKVVISGVRNSNYNGTYTITNVPSNTSLQYKIAAKGVQPSGWGTVVNAEFQELLNYRYGGLAGNVNSTAASVLTGFPNARGGPWYGRIDVDGRAPNLANGVPYTGASSRPIHFTFNTTLAAPVVAGASKTIKVVNTNGLTASGFHWGIYPGMSLGIIDDPTQLATTAPNEVVTVLSVDDINKSFVATLVRPHAPGAGKQIVFGSPTKGTPDFPFGYDNLTAGVPGEAVNNPLGLNLFTQILPNTLPSAAWMEAILRHNGTNGPAMTSEPYRRMPKVLGNISARGMYTTINNKLDRIGGGPVLPFNRNTAGNYVYDPLAVPPMAFPQLPPPGSILVPNPNAAAPNYGLPYALTTNSNFGADWRSNVSNYLRVDLNRLLIDYPAAVVATGLMPNNAVFTRAQTERQNLARDVYNALVRVTGAQDPNVVAVVNPSAEYNASRWLGQLAVNIVDYIDADDIATPFQWYAPTATSGDWVFGTEMPKLVMNELYAQYEGGAVSPSGITNIWVELLNPLMNSGGNPFPLDNGAAHLVQGNGINPIYEIEIHTPNTALTTALNAATNPLGNAPVAALKTMGANTGAANWGTTLTGPTRQVLPVTPPGPIQFSATIAPAGTPGASKVGAVITFKTTAAHNMGVGQPVTIAGVTDPGYNKKYAFIASVPTPTSFTVNGGAGALAASGGGTATVWNNTGFYVAGPRNPAFAGAGRNPNLPATYVANELKVTTPVPSATVSPVATPGATQVGTTVTITTAAAHGFVVGDYVHIAGVAAGYNGNFLITGVTATTFTYTAPAGLANAGGGTATRANSYVSLLLRRLANPYRPHNITLGAAYNPFITVDYLDNIRSAPNFGAATGFNAVGRKQPYSAVAAQIAAQTVAVGGQPKNTFFTHNTPRDTPFDWLVHLDRPLVNPMELLHVSGVRPHDLTQKFVQGPARANKFLHYAPWATQSAMIYRLLESVGTANHMAGTITGGRHPGPVNLNTYTEAEVLAGIIDPQDAHQPNSLFTIPGTVALHNSIIASRTAGGPEGTPFQPLSAGDLQKTIFRNPAGTPLFAIGNPANDHPYLNAALIQKVYNNTTTTSNAFAIWCTVGFFEVLDDSSAQTWVAGMQYNVNDIVRYATNGLTYRCVQATNNQAPTNAAFWSLFPLNVYPPRLGNEIGRDQNRHIRHRFFSIVDRTGMELYRTTTGNAVAVNAANALPQAFNMTITPANVSVMGGTTAAWSVTQQYVPGDTVSSGGAAYFCVQRNIGTAVTNTLMWQPVIQPGMLLEVGVAPNVEVVAVKTPAAWSAAQAYVVGNFVLQNGVIYQCATANLGQAPPNAAFWSANSFQADFMMSHAAGSQIIVRGNPGPRSQYNPRLDKGAVLHFSVIQ